MKIAFATLRFRTQGGSYSRELIKPLERIASRETDMIFTGYDGQLNKNAGGIIHEITF